MSAAVPEPFDPGLLPGTDATQRQREAAYGRFAAAGFPTRKQEAWRYTDLRPLEKAQLRLSSTLDDDEVNFVEENLERLVLPLDGPRIVFVDGAYAPQLSATAFAPGLNVESLSGAWSTLERGLPELGGPEDRPLALLNTALAEQGLVIRVAEQAVIESPLQIVLAGSSEPDLAAHVRIVVELAAGARLSIVQHVVDTGQAAGWLNRVIQVRQAAGSRLTLHTVQEPAGERFHTALYDAQLERDAELTAGFVNTGGRLARNEVDVRLTEPGAAVELFGAALASEGQHADTHIRIDHSAPDTRSTQHFRAIAGRAGQSVFRGKVVVHPDAQRIDAHQRSDNLMLDATAEIDTRPELEIYADDVKCSHGATVGELDEQHLFYLCSRGIPEDAARAVLIYAFANEAVSRIADPSLRKAAAERIGARLPRHEHWEAMQ